MENLKKAKSTKRKIELVVENYDRQKENIMAYKPLWRKQKQIKTIAIYLYYMVKIQNEAGEKRIKINPKARPLLESENIIEELSMMNNNELKRLATSILISSSNKGGFYSLKNKIIDWIKGRRRLYKWVEHKRKKARRTYETNKLEDPKNRREEKLWEEWTKKERKPALVVRDFILNNYINTTKNEQLKKIIWYNNQIKARNFAQNNFKYKSEVERRKQARHHQKQKEKSKAIKLLSSKL